MAWTRSEKLESRILDDNLVFGLRSCYEHRLVCMLFKALRRGEANHHRLIAKATPIWAKAAP
jgi:hypothetical protein